MALERRFGRAFLASLALHVAIAALGVFAMRAAVAPVRSSPTAADRSPVTLVWLREPGPGGGGGGGGNRTLEPPRRAALPGTDARTVPAAKPPAFDSSMHAQADPIQRLIIPVTPLASGTQTLPGAVEAPPAISTSSQGPGRDGGSGDGSGSGDGPGRGDGLGDGFDHGIGGRAYHPGGDVTFPIETHKGTPRYTIEAMRARAQGAITVECVVQTTGVCTNIRVKHSFNPAFGLDEEAIKAAAQWRFRPGTRRGEAVPVVVTMEIAFALR